MTCECIVCGKEEGHHQHLTRGSNLFSSLPPSPPSSYLDCTLMTTAELECCNLGVTRSIIPSASN